MEDEGALELLRDGRLEVAGRLVEATNMTLYCSITLGGRTAACVYKPVRGERPLWDFPDGTLAAREVAAFEVSAGDRLADRAADRLPGGPVRPRHVPALDRHRRRGRPDAPGPQPQPGAAPDGGVRRGGQQRRPQGRPPAAAAHGHVYGVDHGVCFSAEDKLRTVLWQWRGKPLAREAVATLTRLERDLESGQLGRRLRELLTLAEVEATWTRVRRLLETGLHPYPSREWPAIPWPPDRNRPSPGRRGLRHPFTTLLPYVHGDREHRPGPRPLMLIGRARRVRRPALGTAGRALARPPGVLGGRDLKAGGTWLAVDPGGRRAAALLNGHGRPAPETTRTLPRRPAAPRRRRRATCPTST